MPYPLAAVRGKGLTAHVTEYYEKVLSQSPIAYWPLNESSGAVANCLIDSAQDGTYVGVTLGQTGIGDGNTCPLFDGANDHVDIWTATLDAAFDGDEGSVMMWVKVFNADVWADASDHKAIELIADAGDNNLIRLYIASWDSTTFALERRAAANTLGVSPSLGPSTAWMHVALTWSLTSSELKAYVNGAQTGATQAGLLAWVGTLSTGAKIGSVWWGGQRWYGYLAHCAIWDTPLRDLTIADLAKV